MSELNYWQRMNRRRLSRRSMLSASAKAGVGAAGLALVGCGDDDDDDSAPAATAATEEQAEEQAQAQAQVQAEEQVEEQAAQAEEQAEEEQAQVEEEMEEEEEQAVMAGPERGGSLSVFDRGDIASFDGFLTFGYRAFLHGHNVYPMLTQFSNGPDGSPTTFAPELWLADSVEQPDVQTYSFHVRDAANWENLPPTNGRPVTGEDVAFAFSGDRYGGYPNGGIIRPHLDSIDTPDEKTVTFNLNKAFSPFMLYMGHHAGPYTMPPELTEDEASRQTMVGSGPFSLANGGSYDVGTRVVYKRNPDYWFEDKPYVDELIINFIADDSAIAAAMISGELNMSGVPIPKTVKDTVEEAIPDGTFQYYPSNVIGGLNIDLLREPFNDPRVRQALSNAMDRDSALALTNDIETGTWSGPLPVLPPWNIDARDPSGPLFEFYEHNLTRANQLLDAAGVVAADVGPINFAVGAVAIYGNAFSQAGLIYQQNFADLGFDFQLDVREATEHYSTTFNGSGNDGGASHTLSVQVIEPDEAFVNMYGPTSGRSPIINGEEIAKDSTLEELLAGQLAAPDADARKEVIDQIQIHLANQMYTMPLELSTSWNYAAPGIQNYYSLASFAPAPVWEDVWFAT